MDKENLNIHFILVQADLAAMHTFLIICTFCFLNLEKKPPGMDSKTPRPSISLPLNLVKVTLTRSTEIHFLPCLFQTDNINTEKPRQPRVGRSGCSGVPLPVGPARSASRVPTDGELWLSEAATGRVSECVNICVSLFISVSHRAGSSPREHEHTHRISPGAGPSPPPLA